MKTNCRSIPKKLGLSSQQGFLQLKQLKWPLVWCIMHAFYNSLKYILFCPIWLPVFSILAWLWHHFHLALNWTRIEPVTFRLWAESSTLRPQFSPLLFTTLISLIFLHMSIKAESSANKACSSPVVSCLNKKIRYVFNICLLTDLF